MASEVRKALVGRELIKLLAPLLDIESTSRVAVITLRIPHDDLVTATVEFVADIRLLEVDWQAAAAPSDEGQPKGKGKGGRA